MLHMKKQLPKVSPSLNIVSNILPTLWSFCFNSGKFSPWVWATRIWWLCQDKSAVLVSDGERESVWSAHICPLVCVKHTCWKQLRTLGSMLEPPKAATSPSCLGIWMASWSRRPSCLWSHVSPADATWLKRSGQAEHIRWWRQKRDWELATTHVWILWRMAGKGTFITTLFFLYISFYNSLSPVPNVWHILPNWT